MKENDIDKIFRDKLAEFGTPVEPEVWGAIESSLNGRRPAAGAKIHFLSRRIYYWTAAVAAVLLLFLLLGRPEPEELKVEEGLAVAEMVATDREKAVVTAADERVAVEEKPVKITKNQNIGAGAVQVEEECANIEEKHRDQVETDAAAGQEVEQSSIEPQQSIAASALAVAEYGADEAVGKKKRGEYAFSFASNFISSSNVSVSPQYLNYMSVGSIAGEGVNSIEQISQTQYSLPINVAVQAQVKINNLLQVGVGVSYTNLRSKYEALINKKFYHVKQNLNYIGVPVNLYFTFIGKRYFSLYANVGGSIERGVAAVYRLSSYDVVEHRESVNMKGFQYSANMGFGMEYKFIPEIGLYLEPNIVYYFNSDTPASIRTDQPLQIKAEVGFRFHLNSK